MSGISNVSTLRAANVSMYSGMKGMHQHGSVKTQESTEKTERVVAPEAKRLAATQSSMDGNCGMKGMHDKEGSQQKGNSIDFRV